MSTSESSDMWRVERDSTVYVEWKIPKFFDLAYGNDKKLVSPSFSLSEAEWFIWFYPNHNNKIFLCLKTKPSRTVSVTFTMGIKKGNDSVFKHFTAVNLFKNEIDRWISQDIPRSDLSKCKDTVLIDDALVVFLNIRVLGKTLDIFTAEAACQTHSDGFHTLSKDFKNLLIGENEGDVTFHVKDRKFSAHKLVLSTRSTVFRVMLETDMLQKNNGTVDISDADPDHFKQFLHYLYSGELNIVSSNNALGLYLLADKYNVNELKQTCFECLDREISINSFCDVALLASLHQDKELLEVATEFFIHKADAILPTPKWVTFLAEHGTLANELLIKMAIFFKIKAHKVKIS